MRGALASLTPFPPPMLKHIGNNNLQSRMQEILTKHQFVKHAAIAVFIFLLPYLPSTVFLNILLRSFTMSSHAE